MLDRCYKPKVERYPHYGGRGISVCSVWRHSFGRFLHDMGPCPDGCSLDRKDVNGDYNSENCRWATEEEQQNNRRNNVRVEWEGEVRTIAQWARDLNLKYHTLYARIALRGETFPDAARPLYERLAA